MVLILYSFMDPHEDQKITLDHVNSQVNILRRDFG